MRKYHLNNIPDDPTPRTCLTTRPPLTGPNFGGPAVIREFARTT